MTIGYPCQAAGETAAPALPLRGAGVPPFAGRGVGFRSGRGGRRSPPIPTASPARSPGFMGPSGCGRTTVLKLFDMVRNDARLARRGGDVHGIGPLAPARVGAPVRLVARETAVVVVTRVIGRTCRVADRVAVFRPGRSAGGGKTAEVVRAPRREETRAHLSGAAG